MRGTVRHRSRRGLSPKQARPDVSTSLSDLSPFSSSLLFLSSATIHCNPAQTVDAHCIVPNTKAKPNLRCLPSQFLRALVCVYCRVCGSICAHARKPFCPFALLLLDPPRGPQCELSIHSSIDQSKAPISQFLGLSATTQPLQSQFKQSRGFILEGIRVESNRLPVRGPQVPRSPSQPRTTWPGLPLCHIIKPSGDPQKSSGRGRT